MKTYDERLDKNFGMVNKNKSSLSAEIILILQCKPVLSANNEFSTMIILLVDTPAWNLELKVPAPKLNFTVNIRLNSKI